MIDINKQIEHWLNGSDEDIVVAKELIGKSRIRHGLFFAHLAAEKVLKAYVCCHTNDLAPPIHNLVRLADKGGLKLNREQLDLLAEVNEFNIEGRYPELLLPLPSLEEAKSYLKRIGEFTRWLKELLG